LVIIDVAVSGTGCFLNIDDAGGSDQVTVVFDSLVSTNCSGPALSVKNITSGGLTVTGVTNITGGSGIILEAIPSSTFTGAVTLNGTSAHIELRNLSSTVAFNNTVSIGQTTAPTSPAFLVADVSGTVFVSNLISTANNAPALSVNNVSAGGQLTINDGTLTATNSNVVYLRNIALNVTLGSVNAINLPNATQSITLQGVIINNFNIGVINDGD